MDSESLGANASAIGSDSTTPPIGNPDPSFVRDRNHALDEVLDRFDLQETWTDYSNVCLLRSSSLRETIVRNKLMLSEAGASGHLGTAQVLGPGT